MSDSLLSPSQQVLAVFIGSVGTIIVAVISFFGGQAKARADVLNAVTNTFNTLTDQLQEERTLKGNRVVELEGRIAALEQWAFSMENLLRRHDIPVPPRPDTGPQMWTVGQLPKGETH